MKYGERKVFVIYGELVDFSNAIIHATDSFLFIAVGLFLLAWSLDWIEVKRKR